MQIPQANDYVQLLDTAELPCENFTLVNSVTGQPKPGVFLIEDRSGEAFFIKRCEEHDNDLRKGWRQVILFGRPYHQM